MKRFPLIKKLFALLFTAAVLFTVSVRETHYLFSQHIAHEEECENHLHSTEDHAHCAVCKFDVSFFTTGIAVPVITKAAYISQPLNTLYTSPVLFFSPTANPLRGPPVSA